MPIIPDPQALLLAIAGGKVDGTFDIPPTSFANWAKTKDLYFRTFNAAGFTAFSVDQTDSRFDDIHIRKAIAYSIDRKGLVGALLNGEGKPLKCMVSPAMFRSALPKEEVDRGLAKVPGYEYDLAKAKAELAKSKTPNGFAFTLNVPNACAACIAIAQVAKDGLAKIGITVNLNLMPGAARFQIMLDHGPNLGLQILNTGPDNPDPASFPATRWVSSQAVKDGLNFSNWRSPEIDKLVATAIALTDRAKAARLILKGCQLAAEQVSYIPIYTFNFAVAVRDGWSVSSAIGPFYSTATWLKYVRAQ